MSARKFKVGYTQGEWTIIEYPYKSKKVLARCSCGNEEWMWLSNLSSNKSTRCRKCRHKHDPIHSTFRLCKRTAARRRLLWDIEFNDWINLAGSNCYYCDAPPSNKSYGFLYNGLDRINSDGDYELDNVVPCCLICNRAKSNMSQKDFYEWIFRVHDRI